MNSLKNIAFPKNYSDLLQWVSYLWAGTICFPDLQGIFYGVFALLVWGVIKGHMTFSFKDKYNTSFWKSRKTPFYFLLAYLLWMTATIFWSDDIREYFRQFEKLIPLYLLALIGFVDGIEKHININKVLNAFLWGVLIAIGYMVVRMGVDMFVGDTIARIKTAGIMSLDLLTYVNHRTYIGITLLMAIPLVFQNIALESRFQQISTILMVLFIDILCIMAGARILMLLSVIVTIYSIYHVWGHRFSKIVLFVSLLITLSMGGILISKSQRIQSKFDQLRRGVNVEKIEPRTYLWKTSWGLVKEKIVCGYGIGGAEKALVASYNTNNYNLAEDKKQNSHNQYLQILLQGGIIGLLFSLIFILLTLVVIPNKFIAKALLLCFGLGCFFESILVRNIGVFPFVFFYICIITSQAKNTKRDDSIRYIGYIITILLFVVFYVIARVQPVDASDPKTWMMGEYEIINNWDDTPVLEKPLGISNGIMIDFFKSPLYSKDNTFLSYDIASVELSEETKIHIYASIWCYVAEGDYPLKINLSVHDGTRGVGAHYDNAIRGQWQNLIIDGEFNLNDSRFYLLMSTPGTVRNENCKIYFSNPKILIDGENIW